MQQEPLFSESTQSAAAGSYRAQEFIVTPAHALAWQVMSRWPQWSHPIVILCGETGSGKTHLARIWQQRSGADVIADSHETILSVDALDATVSASLRSGTLRPLLLDCQNVTAESETLQRHLCLLYDRQLSAGCTQGGVLLTSSRRVGDWDIVCPDLRSRLETVQELVITAPDEETLRLIYGKLFSDRQLNVPELMLRYLSRHSRRSYAHLSWVVTALDQLAQEHRTRVTTHLIDDVLSRVPRD